MGKLISSITPQETAWLQLKFNQLEHLTGFTMILEVVKEIVTAR